MGHAVSCICVPMHLALEFFFFFLKKSTLLVIARRPFANSLLLKCQLARPVDYVNRPCFVLRTMITDWASVSHLARPATKDNDHWTVSVRQGARAPEKEERTAKIKPRSEHASRPETERKQGVAWSSCASCNLLWWQLVTFS